jgi:hypothetical protein
MSDETQHPAETQDFGPALERLKQEGHEVVDRPDAQPEPTERPRDPQGRFTKEDGEPLVGRSAELAEAGYREPHSDWETKASWELPKDVALSVDQAAQRIQGQAEDFAHQQARADSLDERAELLRDIGVDDETAQKVAESHLHGVERTQRLQFHLEQATTATDPETALAHVQAVKADAGADPQLNAWADQALAALGQQPTPQGHPPAQQQPAELSAKTRELLNDPVVRQEVERKLAAVEEARRQYTEAVPQLAQLAYGELIAEAQELRRMGYDSFEKLAKEDPNRAIAYQAKTQKTQAIINEARSAQQRQAQQYAAGWDAWTRAEDAAWNAANADLVGNREEYEKTQRAAADMLQRELGVDRAGLARLVQQYPALKHRGMQNILRDAARWRNAERAKAAATQKSMPSVPVPGVTGERPSRDYQRIKDIGEELRTATGNRAIKLAAERYMLRSKRGR